MSTVLLLTDAWQPTVLQIVPFSNNNARADDKHMTVKGANGSRSFPVLAVTRQQKSAASSRSGGRSSSSFRSDLRSESDSYSIISSNTSGLTIGHDRRGENNSTASKQKRYKMYAQKRIPEMHSEMKEAIRFSVQDINDQVSSSSSLTSTEKDDSRDKHDRVDSTRTRLPKPSLSNSPDARSFYSPVNGIRRSVPLTPGELELQRIRESYYVDQKQRRKKYKLNVNQLPRSTTPINDHDPDKLNMKQVIAFLQTKTVKENTKNVLNERKGSDNGAKAVQYSRKHAQQYGLGTNNSTTRFAKNTVQSLSRSNSEVKSGMESKSEKNENTRHVPGRVSVMSVKSSPNIPCNRQSPTKSCKTPSIKSSRSFKSNKSDKPKVAKEFKLYRFLAIAPDGRNQGCASTVSNAVPTLEKSFVTEELRLNELPRKQFTHRNTDRETGTTRVLHRHAINRAAVNTPPKNDMTLGEGNIAKPIRLPVMLDSRGETPECEVESISTTPIPILKTKRPRSNTDYDRKSPTKQQSPVPRLELTHFANADDVEDSPDENRPVMTDFMELTPRSNVRSYKAPGFPKVNITAPRQIKVNVPDQSKKIYSQEIVRLTLRQEKNATRVTTYMSDIECASARQLAESSPEQGSSAITPRSNDTTDGETISPLSNASLTGCMV